jgi:AraC-like DNA-binding protein
LSYQQFKPHPALASYIDAYWKVSGEGTKPVNERILPDCCVDIILNLGTNFVADASGFIMKNERAYLVGTMTRYKETIREPGTQLIGIRFKPAAFEQFYRFGALHELTDGITEFDNQAIPSINALSNNFTDNLDHFFLERLSPAKNSIFPIIAEVSQRMGKISVLELARNNYTTVRQLQRLFKLYMGIGPKDFINFVRYQFAVQRIKDSYATKSLWDIAFDSGYYDHAHLSKEIKKHAGMLPSQL